MHSATCFFLTTALALAGSALGVQAQTAPIKPGLWQVHMEREVNGQKAPDMSDRLKNMPPEKRAQIEAVMKQRGIAADGAFVDRVCYTRETLDRSTWANQQTDCKADFGSRSGKTWKWHTSCPKSGYEADGEADFLDSENYIVKSASVLKNSEKVHNSSMTITGKWLGADCGDVKPLDPKGDK